MSWNSKRRYRRKWERYQQRCDLLSYGWDGWFLARDYDGLWDARWKIIRHNLINRGTPSKELTR